MSHFGAKLSELLERRGMRASELSRVTGINDGLISKWINGQQKFVSNDDLASLATGVSGQARERAELIRAHLLDEIAGAGSELIEIRIKGPSAASLKEEATPYLVALPLKLQRAFEVLAREVIVDADVRAVILSLANLLEPDASSGRQAVAAEAEIAGLVEKEASKRSTPPKPSK